MHSINVAITKHNSELAIELLNNKFLFADFNGYLVIGAKKGIRPLLSKYNDTVVFAYTDYFCGSGEQSARLINLKTKKEEHFKTTDAINLALNGLGVEKPEDYPSDLYDYLGLGKIRKNDDLIA